MADQRQKHLFCGAFELPLDALKEAAIQKNLEELVRCMKNPKIIERRNESAEDNPKIGVARFVIEYDLESKL